MVLSDFITGIQPKETRSSGSLLQGHPSSQTQLSLCRENVRPPAGRGEHVIPSAQHRLSYSCH